MTCLPADIYLLDTLKLMLCRSVLFKCVYRPATYPLTMHGQIHIFLLPKKKLQKGSHHLVSTHKYCPVAYYAYQQILQLPCHLANLRKASSEGWVSLKGSYFLNVGFPRPQARHFYKTKQNQKKLKCQGKMSGTSASGPASLSAPS